MEYLKINLDYEFSKNNVAIALGNFDGLHIGHMKLIEELKSLKNSKNYITSVLLFENHSRNIVFNRDFPRIMSFSDKIEVLSDFAIDNIFSIEFDDNFRKLKAEEFLIFLLKKLKVNHIIVGKDYTFGIDQKSVKEIKNYSKKLSFSYSIIQPLEYSGIKVSSRDIIKNIENGNLKLSNHLLGRTYSIKGKVENGFRRGSIIGYPTANIKLDFNYVIPKEGVYFTKTKYENKEYYSFTSIGNNPTFDNDFTTIETHIFDFNKDIYGQEIEVFFIRKFRDNKKFNSIDELRGQLQLDKEKCNEFIKEML